MSHASGYDHQSLETAERSARGIGWQGRHLSDDYFTASQNSGDQNMTSVNPTQLGRKILTDLGPGPLEYSKLRNGGILISKGDSEVK